MDTNRAKIFNYLLNILITYSLVVICIYFFYFYKKSFDLETTFYQISEDQMNYYIYQVLLIYLIPLVSAAFISYKSLFSQSPKSIFWKFPIITMALTILILLVIESAEMLYVIGNASTFSGEAWANIIAIFVFKIIPIFINVIASFIIATILWQKYKKLYGSDVIGVNKYVSSNTSKS